jgi:hypothetical protein
MDNKNVVVTTRVPEELRRELRLILMKNGITVQDFLADTIAKYVRDNRANEPHSINTSVPDSEVTQTKADRNAAAEHRGPGTQMTAEGLKAFNTKRMEKIRAAERAKADAKGDQPQ